MNSQDGNVEKGSFEFGAKKGRHDLKTDGQKTKDPTKGTRFKSQDRQVNMSPKVLETWINETL